MIATVICSIIGLGFWITAVFICVNDLFEKKGSNEKFQSFVGNAIVLGGVGFLFSISGLFYIHRDVEVTYVPPTVLVQSNNYTMVIYTKDNRMIAKLDSEMASWYTATSIAVKVTSGKNILGSVVENEYEIVMR